MVVFDPIMDSIILVLSILEIQFIINGSTPMFCSADTIEELLTLLKAPSISRKAASVNCSWCKDFSIVDTTLWRAVSVVWCKHAEKGKC